MDVLVISEAKIDETFPELQFIIERFSEPYHLDRSVDSGGTLLYVREHIPTKCIKGITVSNSFEGLFTELNLKNKNGSFDVHVTKKILFGRTSDEPLSICSRFVGMTI